MAPKDPVSINQSFVDSTMCAGNDLHFQVEDRGSKKLSSGVFSVKEGLRGSILPILGGLG